MSDTIYQHPFGLPGCRIMYVAFCLRLCHFFCWGRCRGSSRSLLFLSPPLDLLLLKLKNGNSVMLSQLKSTPVSEGNSIPALTDEYFCMYLATRYQPNNSQIRVKVCDLRQLSTYCCEFLQQHKAVFPGCSKFLKGLMALN